MRYFDENQNEIFFYSCVEGDYESTWNSILYGYRKISEEERKQAVHDFKVMFKAQQETIENLKKESGWDILSPAFRKMSKEEQNAAAEKFRREYALIEYIPTYYRFIVKRFDLKDLDSDKDVMRLRNTGE